MLRPEVALDVTLTGNQTVQLLPKQGLAQALINLLNNAADAGLEAGQPHISLQASIRNTQLLLEIKDSGVGFDETARLMAGRVAFSTKPGGAGLGLLLSNTTLSRWGGTLSLYHHPEGGTLTSIALPLSQLQSMT